MTKYRSYFSIFAFLLFFGGAACATDSDIASNTEQHLSIPYALHPARGCTLWQGWKHETAQWHSLYTDRMKKCTETFADFSITLSDFTAPEDYIPVCRGLDAFNREKLSDVSLNACEFCVEDTPFSGEVSGESALFSGFTTKNLTLDNAPLLSFLENACYAKGARQFFLLVGDLLLPRKTSLPALDTDGFVEAFGYQKVRMNRAYDIEHTACYVKKLPSLANTNNAPVTHNTTDFNIVWDNGDFSPPQSILPCFGIFLRDAQGGVKGGLWGQLKQRCDVPHMDIDAFFIDATVRGTGFGKVMMTFAEMYAKQAHLPYILLGTGDHQAPWFYEKMGFTPVTAFPQFMESRQDKKLNLYVYRKSLL